jgi:sodium-dependent phosphate cotransporter
MVKLMRQLAASNIEKALHRILSANAFVTILLSIVITAIIQSSSITTSLLVPLLGAGIITLEHAFALTIGANIGTTVTAILAALAGNMAGLAIAFVHLLFNIFGALIFYPIPFLRKLPLDASRWIARKGAGDKRLVFAFIGLVFFVIPVALIFISKMF